MTTLKDLIRDIAIDAYKLGYKNANGLSIAEPSEEEQEQIDEIVDETFDTICKRVIGTD